MPQLRHSWPALTAAHPARPRRSAHLGPAVNTPTSPGRGLLPISMVLALRRQLTAWSGSAPIGEVAGTAQRSPAPDPFPHWFGRHCPGARSGLPLAVPAEAGSQFRGEPDMTGVEVL